MPYAKCKVYSDGGHFIAIPPTTRPKLPKRYHTEELIEVEDNSQKEQLNTDNCIAKQPFVAQSDTSKELPGSKTVAPKATRKITRKQLFNELYVESSKMKRRERKAFITSKMTPYFSSEKEVRQFVEDNFARQLRNLICRKTRLYRKARLQPWTYFCTFTYYSAKHTEESFRKKLSDTLKKCATAANGNTSACGNAHRINSDYIFTDYSIFRPMQWSANLWKFRTIP